MFTSCTWAMVQKFLVIFIWPHHVRIWAMITPISLLYFTVLMYRDFYVGLSYTLLTKIIGNDNTSPIDNNANNIHCPFYRVSEYGSVVA
jgi:hypothetical protein